LVQVPPVGRKTNEDVCGMPMVASFSAAGDLLLPVRVINAEFGGYGRCSYTPSTKLV
jgi:hypothetical protein